MVVSGEEMLIIIVGLMIYEVRRAYEVVDKKLKRILNSATVSRS
jgi:hypothetical protein